MRQSIGRGALNIGAGLIVTVVVVYPAGWAAATAGFLGNVAFGYYADLNVVKAAVGETQCVESVEYTLREETFYLQAFHLTVRTESGWQVRLTFTHEMDVGKVCERPRGVIVIKPGKHRWKYQAYTVALLGDLLKEKAIRIVNIRDVLCNLDTLVPLFEANYDNDAVPEITTIGGEYVEYIAFSSVPWNRTWLEHARSRRLSEAARMADTIPSGKVDTIEFDFATVDSTGVMQPIQKGKTRSYLERLGNGVMLEMVEIPAGTFLMGLSPAESERLRAEHQPADDYLRSSWLQNMEAETPQHPVSVESFFIGRYEVTQAQWRAVANLPRVNRKLKSEPSFFKGPDLPVERVTWEDAAEFCERLSRAAGREYRLPTEAEWEYACRGGTSTPFHFGETITSNLANYSGYLAYRGEKPGVARDETTPVGVFGIANAFGLYDMHGNVSEWCFDPWHDNYGTAPATGRMWAEGGDRRYHVVRGGAWGNSALSCTATYRLKTNVARSDFGFRVVGTGGR